jgi:hypothetical protein
MPRQEKILLYLILAALVYLIYTVKDFVKDVKGSKLYDWLG